MMVENLTEEMRKFINKLDVNERTISHTTNVDLVVNRESDAYKMVVDAYNTGRRVQISGLSDQELKNKIKSIL